MRRKARIDANQPDIVKALRKIGAKVAITAQLGNGFPDLAVAYKGKWFLLEVKDGPSQKLTEDETDWHRVYGEQADVHVVNSTTEAIFVVTGRRIT